MALLPPSLNRRSLSLRLMLATLLCSVVISVLVSAVQIYILYLQDARAAGERFGQIESGYLPGISARLWDVDNDGIEVLLNGIASLPNVGRVTLQGERGRTWQRNAGAGAGQVGRRSFPITYREGGFSYDVGVLTVELSNASILARLTDRAIGITITSASSLLIGSIFVIFLFRRLVTRHLETMARFVRALDFKRAAAPLRLDRPGQRGLDELDYVVNAINQMQDMVAQHVHDMARIEAELRLHRDHLEALVRQRTLTIEEQNAELALATDKAEAANRAKSAFVANMSHEIRTPMNAVLGVTQLLEATPMSAPQQAYVGMIRSAGQSLMGILNDILDFSKIEAARMELSTAPFALAEVIDAIASIMAVNVGERALDLAIGIEPDVPRRFNGDALRLQQILVNLVGNAMKFTERGEVALLVEQLRRDGDVVQLRLSVTDTGIGMDPVQQERAFTAFGQADASITRRFGGTGIGLTICQRLAELMGGSIAVQSLPGRGSCFSVTLALVALPDTRGAAQPNGRRLLVVDDNATCADYLCRTIRGWGWHADAADSGPAGLARVQHQFAAGQPYDAVLADWQMPGMDGLQMMQALQRPGQAGALAPPVLLMVSAHGRDALLRQPGAAAAGAILIKPVTESALLPALQQLDHVLAAPAPAPAARPQRLRGARLLLVEDNLLNQFVARHLLENAGATVDIAVDGQQAVELLRTDARRYDVVLMDMQMPVLDGASAARLIRGELGLTLPVLAMTAGVLESERALCVAAGMDDFIAKPIDVEQMLGVIERYLPGAPAP